MISYSWKGCYWWISTFAVGPRAVNELETVADRWTFSPFQEQQIFSNEILKISRNCCPHTTCWHDPLEMNSSTLYLGRLNMNHCDHNDDVNPEGKSLVTTLENISNITISMSAASTELSTKCWLASLKLGNKKIELRISARKALRGTCRRLPTVKTPQLSPNHPTWRWHGRRPWRKHWIFCARHFVSRSRGGQVSPFVQLITEVIDTL